MKKEKILIIKTGYSEILDKESNSRIVSLGDVLRTTPLLEAFKKDKVTWVCDEQAVPLLNGIKSISRLLPYDLTTVLQLESEEFDSVINLEKIPGICALSDKIRARKARYGFTFNSQKGTAEAYERAFEVLAVSSEAKYKQQNEKPIQELLFQMVGKKWCGEEYLLGYKPKTVEQFDIGLNPVVGTKWPLKAWPTQNWDTLEEKLKKDGLSVTRQDKQGKNVTGNLYGYMDWINSCDLFITSDSLGLHLALALKKKVIGLFGSTSHKEIFFYGRGQAILPDPCPECMPCFKTKCNKWYKSSCMELISPEIVYNKIKEIKN
jgi:heptosyltransferase-2